MPQVQLDTLFPLYVYTEGDALPEEGSYFVLAGNGLWMHKDTGIVRGFVPVEKAGFLPDLPAEESLRCALPKVPVRHVWRIKEFFRRVVDAHHSEAEITLYYSKERDEFRVEVPEQKVSHASVSYRRKGNIHVADMEDFLRVGTIHSHCDFGAFHSGTDHGDEQDFDGLHVTFGHNHADVFSISASVVVNGRRTKVEPTDVLEGVTRDDSASDRYTFADKPEAEWAVGLEDWMAKVTSAYGPRYGTDTLTWLGTSSHGSITVGSKVVWAGDLSSVQLRSVMGEGPFDVLNVDHGKVEIRTNVGLARLSAKLFKKVA